MKKPDGQTMFLGLAVVIALVACLAVVLAPDAKSVATGDPIGEQGESASPWQTSSPSSAETREVVSRPVRAALNPLDTDRSYRYLQQICELGARLSGSPGMRAQQELLRRHFTDLGAAVEDQAFAVRHPLTGERVAMSNLIVHWHPERLERILLCAHYDTRPFPDRDPDPQQRHGVFIGANDGGSGVAVLMELAHLMPQLQSKVGVDFVLFDGEELVYDEDRDPYFLGSQYFALNYAKQPPRYRYRAAVLLDMVGDRDLQIYQEKHSMSWRDSRPLVESIWRTAESLGVREFVPRRRYEIRDDHLMLHDIAKIPACDLIDFDYGPPGTRISYWHTHEDTPDKCSGESLAKVGWVVWAWLEGLP